MGGLRNYLAGSETAEKSIHVATGGRQPKSGKVTITQGRGFTYTPKAGFKGKDRFCSSSTSQKFKGQRLAGCIAITVR